MIALFPAFVYGAVHHILPYLTPFLITSKVKDRQFKTSIEFAVSVLMYPLFYLLFFFITKDYVANNWILAAYLLTLPFMGIFSADYYQFAIKTLSQLRIYLKKKNTDTIRAFELRNSIIETLDQFYSKYFL